MFQFEKTVFGCINMEKLWGLYSDVSCWKDWDMDVEQVVLDGAFIQGGHGVFLSAKERSKAISELAGSTKRKSLSAINFKGWEWDLLLFFTSLVRHSLIYL